MDARVREFARNSADKAPDPHRPAKRLRIPSVAVACLPRIPHWKQSAITLLRQVALLQSGRANGCTPARPGRRSRPLGCRRQSNESSKGSRSAWPHASRLSSSASFPRSAGEAPGDPPRSSARTRTQASLASRSQAGLHAPDDNVRPASPASILWRLPTPSLIPRREPHMMPPFLDHMRMGRPMTLSPRTCRSRTNNCCCTPSCSPAKPLRTRPPLDPTSRRTQVAISVPRTCSTPRHPMPGLCSDLPRNSTQGSNPGESPHSCTSRTEDRPARVECPSTVPLPRASIRAPTFSNCGSRVFPLCNLGERELVRKSEPSSTGRGGVRGRWSGATPRRKVA